MNRDRAYHQHLSDALAKVVSYAQVGRATFFAETHWQDAVVRQLEIAGEATKRLFSECRARHPDISWRRIAGLRDVLIHDYMGIDLETVWELAQNQAPRLQHSVADILEHDPEL